MQRQEAELSGKVEPSQEQMEGDSSEWSLASLEELKSLNLRDLEEQEEGAENQPKQKEKSELEVKFPNKPTFLPSAALHLVGRVVFTVGELLVIESGGGSFVVDLDNWLSDQQKGLIGFVIDVMGKVEKPYYVVRPEVVTNIQAYQGQALYYIEGSSKILQDEDIKSMRSKSALDAEEDIDSSSDEGGLRVERDFSEEKPERKRTPPRRVNKFRQNQQGEGHRDRTRENFRNDRNASRSRNEQNQRYLNSVYSMHYDQMMRLYNGQFDPQNPPPLQNPYEGYNRQTQAPFGNQYYSQVFPTQQPQQLQQSPPPLPQPQQPIFPQQGLFGFNQTPQNPQNPQGFFGGTNCFNNNRQQ